EARAGNNGLNLAVLHLANHMMDNEDMYGFLSYGDKDTFRFAWLALGTPYYMIEYPAGTCGYISHLDNSFNGMTMVQHDTNNEIIFLHRNLLKWDITRNDENLWQKIKSKKPSQNSIHIVVHYKKEQS
ncbi:MAG: hypothetical protein EOO19_00490, partial [Chryseobacterium sp.]